MPLAFTQEDFLVLYLFLTGVPLITTVPVLKFMSGFFLFSQISERFAKSIEGAIESQSSGKPG